LTEGVVDFFWAWEGIGIKEAEKKREVLFDENQNEFFYICYK
jgi:hypothetical protein